MKHVDHWHWLQLSVDHWHWLQLSAAAAGAICTYYLAHNFGYDAALFGIVQGIAAMAYSTAIEGKRRVKHVDGIIRLAMPGCKFVQCTDIMRCMLGCTNPKRAKP